MANVIIKAAQIVEAALLLLQREIILPGTVWTQTPENFVGALNDTVTLRVPAVLTAKTRTVRATTALTVDEFTEISVPVTLDTHVYKLLGLTDANMTLDISDFARQVLQPQIRSVAEKLEDNVAAALAAATVPVGQQLAYTLGTPAKTVINAANKGLNVLNVPRSDRFMVVGADVEESFLNDDGFRKVNESGSDSALREAVIGRAGGFTILGSNAIAATASYAYHRTAVAHTVMSPALPEGATMKANINVEGMAMRFLKDYDATTVTDRSLVDAFTGSSSVEEGGNNNRLLVITGS